VGDVVRVRAQGVVLGELAQLVRPAGESGLAQVIELDGHRASLQVFSGSKGLDTTARVRFLGHPMRITYSDNILGRIFRGSGVAVDGGPSLETDPRVPIAGPTVNPATRVKPRNMIHARVPMIDLFNSLVESQKIPIFSVAGEPYNQLLARIGFQAEADVLVFGGMGLVYDDFHYFRTTFEDRGVFPRTAMFANLPSDPIVERVLVPDMALAVAKRFAVEEGRRVLLLLTDMSAYADALKEIGISMERIPANRGYMGDLYTQLARHYENACDFQGAGSVTILAVTSVPGDDITHPIPDKNRLHHRGPALPARRHDRPLRQPLATEAERRLEEHPGGPCAGHERDGPPVCRNARGGTEAVHGIRALGKGRALPAVRTPVPRALHGPGSGDVARGGARPGLRIGNPTASFEILRR
jgi:V/A-type H+-transporting ATPase subunit B